MINKEFVNKFDNKLCLFGLGDGVLWKKINLNKLINIKLRNQF